MYKSIHALYTPIHVLYTSIHALYTPIHVLCTPIHALVSQLQFELPLDVTAAVSFLFRAAGDRCSYGRAEKITRLFWVVGLGEFTSV